MHEDIEQSLFDAGLELKPKAMDSGMFYRALAEYFAVSTYFLHNVEEEIPADGR